MIKWCDKGGSDVFSSSRFFSTCTKHAYHHIIIGGGGGGLLGSGYPVGVHKRNVGMVWVPTGYSYTARPPLGYSGEALVSAIVVVPTVRLSVDVGTGTNLRLLQLPYSLL